MASAGFEPVSFSSLKVLFGPFSSTMKPCQIFDLAENGLFAKLASHISQSPAARTLVRAPGHLETDALGGSGEDGLHGLHGLYMDYT